MKRFAMTFAAHRFLLALQACAGLAALAPVFFLQLQDGGAPQVVTNRLGPG
jgi:hypothetical protein